MKGSPAPRLAYLVSLYPATSHTFILREVLKLRKWGISIHVASINSPLITPLEATQDEHEALDTTFYVKKQGVLRAAHYLLLRPMKFLKALREVINLAGWNLKELIKNLCYLGEAAIVGRWMNELGIQHLHVHFANPAATVALFVNELYPFTISIMVHGPDEFDNVLNHHVREKIEKSHFVGCIGKFARSQLMKITVPELWDKFELVPLGVDTQIFHPDYREPSSSRFQILCIGRLVPAKGQYFLIQAFQRVLKTHPEASLTLVGDGPDREGLQTFVKAHNLNAWITFTGSLNQDAVRSIYRTANLFVLPSLSEGIPVVLMEAMSFGIPCISTFVNGIPELIQNNDNGILVLPSDVEALADAIIRCIEDPQLCHYIGKRARDRVLDAYQLDKNTEHLASVFKKRLSI